MRIKEIKVGILTLTGLIIAYLGFNYLKGNGLFNKGVTFYSIYQDVEGLHVGSKVVLNGYPIGKVKTITFLGGGSGRLVAEYAVTDKSIEVSKNTVAQILSTDLFGSKAINLIIGDASERAGSGDTLTSKDAEGMMSEVNRRIAPYEEKAKVMLARVDTLLQSVQVSIYAINEVLSSEKNNIHEITTNLVSITENINQNNEHISSSLANIHTLTDSLSQADIKKILDNANLAVISMKEAMEKINNGSGTMGKMINDSSLYVNLNKSAYDLDMLLKDMQGNPKKYVHFSIWGGKDTKESTESKQDKK
ncbi:MAG: phospholipid/cholesterol/gamma-HCH transport system substrate-binding protein [Salibacteraceae bacterium]|jgi:phospholipid/cholesterol/gamma-HCH transport system substrate-binding protein